MDEYLLTGETQSFNEPFGDVYRIKTDSVGNTLWTRTYGGAEYDRAVHVLQTPDGGYLLSGSTQSLGAADQNGYIIKTNSMGDTLWTKVLGGAHTCSILYFQQTSDGNHVAVGYISETGFGKSDVYIIKFDPSGNILWTRNLGGSDNDVGHCINETQDGGLIIVGGTKSFSSDQNNDLYLIKTNGAGNLTQINETQSTPLPAAVGLLTCYPNPFNSSTKLIFNLNKAENVSLKIFNLLGKEIETLLSEKYMTAGEHEMIWTADHLASGLYVCQLKTGQRVFTKKLLYQK